MSDRRPGDPADGPRREEPGEEGTPPDETPRGDARSGGEAPSPAGDRGGESRGGGTGGSRDGSERRRPPVVVEPVYWEDDAEEISLIRLVNVLLEHRRIVVGLPLLVAFLVVGYTMLQPRSWTSSASFMPQGGGTGGQLSRISGLAAQFGVNVPTGESGESPQFYAELLRSREILESAARTRYDFTVDGDAGAGTAASPDTLSGSLVELFEIEARTPALATKAAVGALRNRTSVSTNAETGVVEVSVTTPWPELSRQVADRLIGLVNEFNLRTRRSQAQEERQFLENRLEQARAELHAAEDSLERFLERNRSFENSPTLRFENQRLERRVELRQQVYSSLSQSYEEAKIAEVRNTPVITVVEPPDAPARPDPRRVRLKGVLGLLLGGMAGVFWAFGREFMEGAREHDPDDYREFETLRRETAEELRGLWRRVRGKERSGAP